MKTLPVTFLGAERVDIREWLCQGASGDVYRAYDRLIGREIALKTMRRPGPEEMLQLKSEFRFRAGLAHPYLLQLHDLFAGEDACFFTMELVRGSNFLEWIRGDLHIGPGAGSGRPRSLDPDP